MKNDVVRKSGWEIAALRGLASAACVAGVSAFAQDAVPHEAVAAATRAETPVRMEINATSLPRLDAPETGASPRVDLSLLPPGGSGVGLMMGMSNYAPRPDVGPSFGPSSRANVDVGLH